MHGGVVAGDGVTGRLESHAGALLSLGSDDLTRNFTLRTFLTATSTYLSSGLSGGLSLRCHGSLQLDWKSHVFAV